ncbi:hypothetical protein P280DRAFT_150667 [Massarina eburnea CBS 473.64]|uniref:Uncharacterized protein n=1 Tax=Massarina eburnea CBS 473.64 TaxID=1395130 RepID=A0A6A6RMF2_9PLEO|nr:hypothetical protein P280DRAFT_150667 [Massarina eburnea CBS 473.64]
MSELGDTTPRLCLHIPNHRALHVFIICSSDIYPGPPYHTIHAYRLTSLLHSHPYITYKPLPAPQPPNHVHTPPLPKSLGRQYRQSRPNPLNLPHPAIFPKSIHHPAKISPALTHTCDKQHARSIRSFAPHQSQHSALGSGLLPTTQVLPSFQAWRHGHGHEHMHRHRHRHKHKSRSPFSLP